VIVYPHYIRNRSHRNAMWRDNQPHGYSRPILFPHSAKRVRDCRQNHHDCRQNIPWLLWNALLTTPYVSEHYKYTFLVARDLYEMFVLYRGKHEVKYDIPYAGPRIYRGPAACTWESFQTTGAWCVEQYLFSSRLYWSFQFRLDFGPCSATAL